MLPFARFAGADSVLGPEMKSTGEVMGIAADFPTAFGKAQAAAGVALPTEGSVFITVTDTDKPAATQIAARFHDLGFEVIATGGTAQAISRDGRAGDPDQQDRRGLAARRRPDPRAPLRPRDQHPDRLRRPRRRLRDPHRRGPPRDPLRDDDDRRLRRGPGDRRRQAGRRRGALACRRSTAPRHPAPRRRSRAAIDRRRFRAGERPRPFGRRLCEVDADRGLRRLPDLLPARPEGPAPEPGQFYMLATEQRWGRAAAGPSCRARSRSPRRRRPTDGVRLDFLVEGVGPGTDRLCELEPGERVWVTGPLGNAFSSRASCRPDAAGAILVGGGIGVAPLALLRRRFAERGVPTRVLLGFRDQAHSGGLDDLFACCEVRLASEDGHTGHQRLRHRPARGDARGRRRRQRRRLRLRPAGDAGGGAGDVRRARRRLRAGHGVADGLRLRRLLRLRGAASRAAATCASASTARCVAASRSRPRWSPEVGTPMA